MWVSLVFLCGLFCFVCLRCVMLFLFCVFCDDIDSSAFNEDIVRLRCGGGKSYTVLCNIFVKIFQFFNFI